jgi:hypothetical protein
MHAADPGGSPMNVFTVSMIRKMKGIRVGKGQSIMYENSSDRGFLMNGISSRILCEFIHC